jgi:hypothetical protein
MNGIDDQYLHIVGKRKQLDATGKPLERGGKNDQ